MKHLLFIIVSSVLLLAACKKESTANIETMTIASEKGKSLTPLGNLADCYWDTPEGTWSPMINAIEGFEYTPGHEYVLRACLNFLQ